MGITKRGAGVWQITWELGKDAQGRRRQESERYHCATKKEALQRYVERQKQLNENIGRDAQRVTIDEVATSWLHAKALVTRPNTLAQRTYLVDRFIRPTLGSVRIKDLTPLHVQRALQVWLATPRQQSPKKRPDPAETPLVSVHTAVKAYQIAAMILDQAVKWEMVSRNVVRLVDPPSIPKRLPTWWSVEEARQFLAVAPSHMHGVVYVLALLTGLRKGELLGLRWQDIDWTAGTLTVRQNQDSHHVREFAAPKTQAGRRTIALDANTLELLRAHQTAQKRQRLAVGPAWQDWDLVCCTGIGSPLSARNVSRDFDKLQTQAGVPRIRFHDLRHTHGSLLREHGADLRIIADRLGHTQVSFTAQVYVHARTDAQQAPATAISQALFSALVGPTSSKETSG